MKKPERKTNDFKQVFKVEAVFIPLPPDEVSRRSERLRTLLFEGALKYVHDLEVREKKG